MKSRPGRNRRYLASTCLIAGAGLSLAACASGPSPRYQIRPGPLAQAAPPSSPSAAQSGGGGRYKVGSPYQINGQWYYPAEQPNYDETGVASWYGDAFNGKPTANGEVFDMHGLSAAHKTLPLPSIVEVTNLDNGRSMQLRVNDRGPFVDNRVIDLSRGAAEELGVLRPGLAKVRVKYVGPAPLQPKPLPPVQIAAVTPPPPPVAPVIEAPAPVVTAAAPPPQPTITQTELAPIQQAAATAPVEAQAAPVLAAAAPSFEVQAGAFSNLANAERVATQLADAGVVEIQTVQREAGPLYRVMVRQIGDEGAANVVRERVAQIGIADARIVLPY